MRFFGIDLGWSSRPSGLCCLEWTDQQLQLIDLDRIEAIADILTRIDTRVKLDEPAIIAVDAPTLIPNATGMRLPDKLTHKYFGKYHAGCYPAKRKTGRASLRTNKTPPVYSKHLTHPQTCPQPPSFLSAPSAPEAVRFLSKSPIPAPPSKQSKID